MLIALDRIAIPMRLVAATCFVAIVAACVPVQAAEPSGKAAAVVASAPRSAAAPKRRAAVLSAKQEPSENTSQGLYIRILREAGFEARAISAEEVRETKLANVDIFIIGGGRGPAFNRSLGPVGGKIVREFVRNGGGALASCAGGYSFAIGQKEELKYISIAHAEIFDAEDGRWARGKGNVEIAPADKHYRSLTMFYANGPLWTIGARAIRPPPPRATARRATPYPDARATDRRHSGAGPRRNIGMRASDRAIQDGHCPGEEGSRRIRLRGCPAAALAWPTDHRLPGGPGRSTKTARGDQDEPGRRD